MTWLLRLPDVLPVRLLDAEPIAFEIDGVQLAKDDVPMPVLEAPEVEDVDCELPMPDRSDDKEDKGWLSKPAAITPTLPSDMNCSFDEFDRNADRQIVFKARNVPGPHFVDQLGFADANGRSRNLRSDLSGKECLRGKNLPGA
jgi:hypothetical protein